MNDLNIIFEIIQNNTKNNIINIINGISQKEYTGNNVRQNDIEENIFDFSNSNDTESDEENDREFETENMEKSINEIIEENEE